MPGVDKVVVRTLWNASVIFGEKIKENMTQTKIKAVIKHIRQ